jgi:hypothetical protein
MGYSFNYFNHCDFITMLGISTYVFIHMHIFYVNDIRADDDDVYLDRIAQHKPKTIFHM